MAHDVLRDRLYGVFVWEWKDIHPDPEQKAREMLEFASGTEEKMRALLKQSVKAILFEQAMLYGGGVPAFGDKRRSLVQAATEFAFDDDANARPDLDDWMDLLKKHNLL